MAKRKYRYGEDPEVAQRRLRTDGAKKYDLPIDAIGPNGLPYMAARLKNPNNPKEYYRKHGIKGKVWVTLGYDRYTLADWRERFGKHPDPGRHFEFFGDQIEIWDPDDKGNPDE